MDTPKNSSSHHSAHEIDGRSIVDSLSEPSFELSRNLAMDLTALRVPILRRLSGGQIRVISKRHVLVVFLDSSDLESSWGTSFWVSFEDSFSKVEPTEVSRESLLPWEAATATKIRIEGSQGTDMMTFENDGWGKNVRFIAFATFRGNAEQAEAIAADFEVLAKKELKMAVLQKTIFIEGLFGNGADAEVAFEKFWKTVEEPLRDRLQSWNEIVGPIPSKVLAESLVETGRAAMQSIGRESPEDPAMWLLELAAKTLLKKLRSHGDNRLPKKLNVDAFVASQSKTSLPRFVVTEMIREKR